MTDSSTSNECCKCRSSIAADAFYCHNCLRRDHIYHELLWRELFYNRNGRYPGDEEYPERFPECHCRVCDPPTYESKPGNGLDDEIRRAHHHGIMDVVAMLGLGSTKRSGSEYLVQCPFHDDNRPSMRLDPQKNVWYCDPCGVGGDVIELYARHENLAFHEAVKELAAT